MTRRVVITGLGLVTPLGHDVETCWARLVAGESGVDRISSFRTDGFSTRIAGEVRDFDLNAVVDRDVLLPKGLHKHSTFAVGAAVQAWADAGLEGPSEAPERTGVFLGAGKGLGIGDLDHLVPILHDSLQEGEDLDLGRFYAAAEKHVPQRLEIEAEPSRATVLLAHIFQALGPQGTYLTSCAAGSQSTGEAFKAIREGDADLALAGGSHSMVTPLGLTGFSLLNALSTRNDTPRAASRPFDRDRDGFILGEGAGILILEEREHALERGARIHAELIGYGCASDAYRVTDPHPCGAGGAAAMRRAIADAGISLDEIDYINAHGTSTQANDRIETQAIKDVLGDRAYQVPISSNKSLLGHLIAAAGAVELAFSCLTLRDEIIPPTINYETPDPDCDLDYVPNEARRVPVRTIVSNSFGFGGQNAVLIIRKPD